MATASNGNGFNEGKLRISECSCPICMYILIEPVTMPCGHELCMPCYTQHVAQTSLFCPLCRTRLSVWARKAARQNKLVNEERWKEIQEAFPDRVQDRLDGNEPDSDDSFDIDYVIPNLAEPGELRREYEEEKHKIDQEIHEAHQLEEEASLQLIAQLQEQEAKRREQEQRDIEVAVRLSKELNGVTPACATETRSRVPESLLGENQHNRPVTHVDKATAGPVMPRTKSLSLKRSHPSASSTQKGESSQQQGHLKMWFKTKPKEGAGASATQTSSAECKSPSSCTDLPGAFVRTTLLTPRGIHDRQEALRRGEEPASVQHRDHRQHCVSSTDNISESPVTEQHKELQAGATPKRADHKTESWRKRLCLREMSNS